MGIESRNPPIEREPRHRGPWMATGLSLVLTVIYTLCVGAYVRIAPMLVTDTVLFEPGPAFERRAELGPWQDSGLSGKGSGFQLRHGRFDTFFYRFQFVHERTGQGAPVCLAPDSVRYELRVPHLVLSLGVGYSVALGLWLVSVRVMRKLESHWFLDTGPAPGARAPVKTRSRDRTQEKAECEEKST